MNFRPPHVSNGCLDSRTMETIVNDTRALTVHTLCPISGTRERRHISAVNCGALGRSRTHLRLLLSTFGGATVNPFHLMRRDLINLMSIHRPQQSIYARCGIVAASVTPFGQLLLLSTGIFRLRKAATRAQPLPSKVNPRPSERHVSRYSSRHNPPTATPQRVSRGALKDRRNLVTKLLPDVRQWDSRAGPGRS